MQYLLMVWLPDDDGAPEGGTKADYDVWMEYEAAMKEAGVYRESGSLQPYQSGTWVTTDLSKHPATRVDEAEVYATAEFGGFYLIEVADLYEAETWARRMPTYGDVEVRPLIDYTAQFG